MNCIDCGSHLIDITGNIELDDNVIGPYVVENVHYKKCESCGEVILSNESWLKADNVLKEITDRLIGQLPAHEFVSATEAAQILEISKQAFSKNRRIKKGFIHQTIVNGRIGYHKKSVELFKNNKDGRFRLYDPELPTFKSLPELYEYQLPKLAEIKETHWISSTNHETPPRRWLIIKKENNTMPQKSIEKMKLETKSKKEELVIHGDISTKTLWVDNFALFVRDDDICLLRLNAKLPEGYFEQARIATSKKHLKALLDLISKQLNYYPQPVEKIDK